jgi:hypothetical protein
MVGEFCVDYGPIPQADLERSNPEMEALLQRSHVISAKRGP